MGSDCCSGAQRQNQCTGTEETELPSDNRGDHDHANENRSDDGQLSVTSSLLDLKLECCTSQEERCDNKCIVAAAAIACEKTCADDVAHDDASSHKHAHGEDGKHGASACSAHLTQAFEQYSAYLESARCICRSVLERGLSSVCCREQKKQQHPAHQRQSDPKVVIGASSAHNQHSRHRHTPGSSYEHHQATQPGLKRRSAHVQSEGEVHEHAAAGDRPDCCSGHNHPQDPIIEDKNTALEKTQGLHRDVEREAGLEHVVLTVDGMTCSGCGNKLQRALSSLPGVSRVKVNFVLGSAEFKMNSEAGSADETIRKAEQASGFHCARLSTGDQILSVLASGTFAKAIVEANITGVTQATVTSKKTVNISFDPSVIGARDLLKQLDGLTEGLAPPSSDPSITSSRRGMYDTLIKTAVSAVFTIPVLVLTWGNTGLADNTRAIVSLALATIVQSIAVPVFYEPAIKSLLYEKTVEMDMLVTISITAAYLYSVVAFGFRMADRPLDTSEFFETSALLITLVLLGRLVAAFARVKAVSAVSLRSLQAATAVLIDDGEDREVDARLLQYGDLLRILPHSRVPTDGSILSGTSEVDESMLTGESVPSTKQAGDSVLAGTVNGSGVLQVRLTRIPGKNTVSDIAELVEAATNAKPKIQDLADRVASWFVQVVTAIAIIVTIIWIIVGLKVRRDPVSTSVANAITFAVAVLAISCPCALGLAVPMVLVVAGGIAARGGVIIKTAECLERARKVTDVVFDKTGTLTEDKLEVVAEEHFGVSPLDSSAIIKTLVAGNKHPVSVSVNEHLQKQLTKPAVFSDVRVIPGNGVEVTQGGVVYRAGNPYWTQNQELPEVRLQLSAGLTTLLVTRDSSPIALFGLRTILHPEAATVISQLQRQNIAIHLVSGDQARAVEAVATAVNIPLANVAARRTPAQKGDYVAALRSEGRAVLFCGDGTNDAVAVAQADIGVQRGGQLSSSDVTQGAADAVLLKGLDGVLFLLHVSRAASRRIMFNFIWSAAYNLLAILLAAGAFVNVRIPPAYAGLGEIVSVLPVVLAAMTMLLLNRRTLAK